MDSLMLPNLQGDVAEEARRSYGEALASSPLWEATCDGLDGWDRINTAVLLENQRKYMNASDDLVETTKVLQIGNFDKFAFPIIRAVYPQMGACNRKVA